MRNCHRDAIRRQKKSKGLNDSEVKIWKYQQQMEFLIPFMVNKPFSPHNSDNKNQPNLDDRNSEDENLLESEKGFELNVVMNKDFNKSNENLYEQSGENKKIKLSECEEKLSGNHIESSSCGISLERNKEFSDPLYSFFLTMYLTTAQMSSKSQHIIKKEIFRIVSDAEEIFLNESAKDTNKSDCQKITDFH